MKQVRKLFIVVAGASFILFGGSCSPKYGCPTNGKNVGAERIMSGEMVPKAKKFRS
jgi:hypothetical protein